MKNIFIKNKRLYVYEAILMISTIMSRAYGASAVALVDPIPDLPETLSIASVPMGNLEDFDEYQLEIDITDGSFRGN